MQVLDARRLTGPNFLLDSAGAAVELTLTPAEQALAGLGRDPVQRLLARLARMSAALDWPIQPLVRRHAQGATVAFAAPIDRLNTAADMLEWAANPKVLGSFSRAQARLANRLKAELNPALLRLQQWAQRETVRLLWDDQVVSLGSGASCLSWPAADLPDPEQLNPGRFAPLPTALITGTNGKTTTSRLLARMVRSAGLQVGNTTTDGWSIDEQLIEAGDWTGPGAARKVLRDARVQCAVLETARGGLMRRGLAVQDADVAVVTNASDDHLGEWGLDSVAQMAEAKLTVAKGVIPGGCLVLNADNPALVDAVARLGLGRGDLALAWFSIDPSVELQTQLVRSGAAFAFAKRGTLWWQSGGLQVPVATLEEVPICFGGHAQHNVANALAALLAGHALGLPWEAIRQGLRTFKPSATDNPGRANRFSLNGAQILLDFAHNPDGVRQIVRLARALPATRRATTLGQGGDRSDEAIRALADTAYALGADLYILKESLHYLRGRPLGEVTGILRDQLLRCGANERQIAVCADENAALDTALAWLKPGDLIILLIHDDFNAALNRLTAAGALPA